MRVKGLLNVHFGYVLVIYYDQISTVEFDVFKSVHHVENRKACIYCLMSHG